MIFNCHQHVLLYSVFVIFLLYRHRRDIKLLEWNELKFVLTCSCLSKFYWKQNILSDDKKFIGSAGFFFSKHLETIKSTIANANIRRESIIKCDVSIFGITNDERLSSRFIQIVSNLTWTWIELVIFSSSIWASESCENVSLNSP